MLHIYSGNGKGKTTAGFGLVLRQAGYERRVAVAQFLKDGTSGELRALQALSCTAGTAEGGRTPAFFTGALGFGNHPHRPQSLAGAAGYM